MPDLSLGQLIRKHNYNVRCVVLNLTVFNILSHPLRQQVKLCEKNFGLTMAYFRLHEQRFEKKQHEMNNK